MQRSLERYRPSGRTSWRFVPAVVVAGALAIGLGWLYQRLTVLHYVFLGLCEYAAFLALVAAIVVTAGRLGRNRNRRRGAVVGLLLGALALGAAFYFDWRTMANGDPTFGFGDFLDRRVELGWTLGKRHPGDAGTLTGVLVWLAWLLEALGVLGVAAGFGAGFGPYCEHCDHWIDVEDIVRRAGLDGAAVEAVAKATTVDALVRAPVPSTPAAPFTLIYKVHRCKTCASDAYVTITREHVVLVKREPWGMRPKTKSDTLHVQVAVPRDRLRSLLLTSVPPASG
jgi:hypothetical protein